MTGFFIGLAIFALAIAIAIREPRKASADEIAAPSRWSGIGRLFHIAWIGVQTLIYLTVTTSIAAILVFMVLGPDMLLDETWWIAIEASRPWAGWWLPQCVAGLATFPLVLSKVHVVKWALATKDDAAFQRIKTATELIACMIFVLGVFITLSTVIGGGINLALWVYESVRWF